MQPGMAKFSAPNGSSLSGRRCRAAAEAPAWRRLHQLPVEPFGNAAGEGASFGFCPAAAAFELGDARPLLEERVPVLGRPAAGAGSQQTHVGLVPSEAVEKTGAGALGP